MMRYKKGLLFTGLLILSFSLCQAQSMRMQSDTLQRGFQKEKLFVGGNLGLSFGSSTYINVSPLIGYRFSEMFAAGAQINGLYESTRYIDTTNTTKERDRFGMVGLGLFGRLYPIPQFFLQIQPEVDHMIGTIKYYNPSSTSRYHLTVPAFLAGGGYSQSIGPNSAFVIMLLYDVFQDDNSPYGNSPVFRAGVDIGF